MVQNILHEVDTNGDGRIDYDGESREIQMTSYPDARTHGRADRQDRSLIPGNPEFRAFIDHTESGLWQMFQRIDRNKNGEIDKAELRSAFAQSGVTVSSARLDHFFAEVDKNNDGVISYTEWRCVHSKSKTSTATSTRACLFTDNFFDLKGFSPLPFSPFLRRPTRCPILLHGHGQSKPGRRCPHQ